jgi:hypothetical protein
VTIEYFKFVARDFLVELRETTKPSAENGSGDLSNMVHELYPYAYNNLVRKPERWRPLV